ncbi:MAG: hypothetical protein HY287_08120 [Planctomycetes bacterium]|nr:hypothetical protein [Planctomycetota bacterium]
MKHRTQHQRFSWGCYGRTHRAVTLLEVLLAMGLLVILSTMTYWFYSSSVETRDRDLKEADKLRLARVVVERIATEIRQASSVDVEGRVGITGGKEQIWLLNSRVPTAALAAVRAYDEIPAGVYDLEKVTYSIARHPDVRNPDGFPEALGLARVEILSPKPFDPSMKSRTTQPTDPNQSGGKNGKQDGDQSKQGHGGGKSGSGSGTGKTGSGAQTGGGQKSGNPPGSDGIGDDSEPSADQAAEDLLNSLMSDQAATENNGDVSLQPDINWEELYAPEIHYLRFCYFDGKTWWDQWEVSGENPLPQMVMITVGFVSHAPLDDTTGGQISKEQWNDEFCTCLNKDPVDCFPLAGDQYSTVVRIAPSDPLFRSRVTREGQNVVEQLNKASKEGTP